MDIEKTIKDYSIYGDIEKECGEWIYRPNEDRISEAKFDRLTQEQQTDLQGWLVDGKDEYSWYEKNAKGIWDYIEEQAGLEETCSVDVINDIKAEEISEEEEERRYDAMIQAEYYRDRI